MKSVLVLVAVLAVAFAVPRPNHEEKESEPLRPKAGRKLVCYYGSWAVYRPEPGKFDIEQIDPFLCTHLIYGFAKLDESSWKIAAYDPWNDLDADGGKGAYRRFNALKNQNPDLVVLLAIGGWNEGSEKYSDMAADPGRRAIFVQSCVEFLREHGFQGLDMDWEYPTFRGGDEDDKLHFAELLRDLGSAFKQAGLLLTSAVSAGRFTIESAYDIQALIENLDIVNIMSYDYHGAWDPFVHHNAPVLAHPGDIGNGEYEFFNVDFTIRYWIDLMGEHSDRLVLGMPLYGRGFTLDDPSNPAIYAGASRAGIAGPYTRQDGILGYNELCEIKRDQGANFRVFWEDTIKAKYVIFDSQGVANQWYSWDDTEALQEKVNLINSLPIGGGMVWSIETDDFTDICGDGKNSLLRYIVTAMNGAVPTPDPTRTTTPHVTRETTTRGTVVTLPPDDQCQHGGLNPTGPCSPDYVICAPGDDGWIVTPGTCPPTLVINPDPMINNCDYCDHVPACAGIC